MNKPGFPIVSEKGERRLKIRQKANFLGEKGELTKNIHIFIIRLH
jgi:hypothetical protein